MTKSDLKSTGINSGDLKSNPLPEIVNCIPWQYTVIGPKFLDDIRAIVIRHDVKLTWYSDAYVMLLLIYLFENQVVNLMELPVTNSIHPVILVKRV